MREGFRYWGSAGNSHLHRQEAAARLFLRRVVSPTIELQSPIKAKRIVKGRRSIRASGRWERGIPRVRSDDMRGSASLLAHGADRVFHFLLTDENNLHVGCSGVGVYIGDLAAYHGYALSIRQKHKFVLPWQRSEPIIEDVFGMKRGPFIVLEHKFDTHTPSRAGRSTYHSYLFLAKFASAPHLRHGA